MFVEMEDKHSSEVIHCQGNRIKSLLSVSKVQFKPNISYIVYTCE